MRIAHSPPAPSTDAPTTPEPSKKGSPIARAAFMTAGAAFAAASVAGGHHMISNLWAQCETGTHADVVMLPVVFGGTAAFVAASALGVLVGGAAVASELVPDREPRGDRR